MSPSNSCNECLISPDAFTGASHGDFRHSMSLEELWKRVKFQHTLAILHVHRSFLPAGEQMEPRDGENPFIKIQT